MKRKVIETADGSSTILIEEWGESFHSTHGAIQEAQLVYIQNGLRFVFEKELSNLHVLEIGFGTGLNCFLSVIASSAYEGKINYTGIEGFPLQANEWQLLNYHQFYDDNAQKLFESMHEAKWEEEINLSPNFSLVKHEMFFEQISFSNQFDLVYFDAFGYQYQPELWTEEIFLKIKKAMKPNAILVTYACKGEVNRTLKKLGFKIAKLPGPPGKREMTRAFLIK